MGSVAGSLECQDRASELSKAVALTPPRTSSWERDMPMTLEQVWRDRLEVEAGAWSRWLVLRPDPRQSLFSRGRKRRDGAEKLGGHLN